MNLAALGSADYRRYALGNVFALNGVWLSRVTMSWLAWDLTGQAGFVGLVAFLAFAPTLVSGPFFGVLADRIALKRAAMMTQAGLATAALVLLGASLAGLLGPGLLAAVALGSGIVSSAHHPVRLALAPALVPREMIASAVALGSVNFNLARLTGPAIGGAVIASRGVDWALALAVLCFLPTIALLPGLRPRHDGAKPRRTGIVAALGDGIRAALGTVLIRRAMLVIGLFSLVGRGLLEILPVLADGVFARGAGGLGTLAAAAGGGALVAATLITLGPGQRPGRLPLSSRLAAPAGLALVAAVAFAPPWPVTVGLVAALGLCGTLTGVGLQSAVQLAVPDAYRARIMSLWTMLAVGGSALGAILLGSLVDALGPGAALGLAAGLGLAPMLPAVARPLAGGGIVGTSAGTAASAPPAR
jgi:MFS family permease